MVLLRVMNSFASGPNIKRIRGRIGKSSFVLGDFDSAKDYLKRAFAIDPNLRLLALEDEDLKLLWRTL